MEQTFSDLYKEHQTENGWFGFILWIFIETAIGIIREHVLLIKQGITMKSILTNHNSAAVTGLILSLPLGLIYTIFLFDIQLLIEPLKSLFTTNGSNINMPGRIVIFGGLFLLPVAFVINLLPMLKREGPEKKRTLHISNLIVGAGVLLLIIFTWGALILEQIYCLQGIRCN